MVNKSILIGRLTRDPEIRYTSAGAPVASFSIATNEKWAKDGKKKESVEYHNIVAWNKLAEICEQYLKKGSLVYLEGRIQNREWDDKGGNKRRTTEIIAYIMQMLDSKPSQHKQQEEGYPDDQDTPPGTAADGMQHDEQAPEITDDNLPF